MLTAKVFKKKGCRACEQAIELLVKYHVRRDIFLRIYAPDDPQIDVARNGLAEASYYQLTGKKGNMVFPQVLFVSQDDDLIRRFDGVAPTEQEIEQLIRNGRA